MTLPVLPRPARSCSNLPTREWQRCAFWREEQRYRIIVNLEGTAGRFTRAIWHSPAGEALADVRGEARACREGPSARGRTDFRLDGQSYFAHRDQQGDDEGNPGPERNFDEAIES
jgi:hypothetical protein